MQAPYEVNILGEVSDWKEALRQCRRSGRTSFSLFPPAAGLRKSTSISIDRGYRVTEMKALSLTP
jgi:hypothetical protein